MQVTLEEAQQNLRALCDAALRGEEVLVLAKGEINATIQLVPRAQTAMRRPGSARGRVHMREDFDEPIEEFKEYME